MSSMENSNSKWTACMSAFPVKTAIVFVGRILEMIRQVTMQTKFFAKSSSRRNQPTVEVPSSWLMMTLKMRRNYL